MAARRPGRVVPAVPAGSWLAAANRFVKSVTIPRVVPITAYTKVTTVKIGPNGIASGLISGAGTATVGVGPQGYGTRWYPNQVSIATQTGANDTSTCQFYLNAIPGGILGTSYAGGGDQPGFALPEMQPGDLLYAVWSGGHAGDWCQITITGTMDVLMPS